MSSYSRGAGTSATSSSAEPPRATSLSTRLSTMPDPPDDHRLPRPTPPLPCSSATATGTRRSPPIPTTSAQGHGGHRRRRDPAQPGGLAAAAAARAGTDMTLFSPRADGPPPGQHPHQPVLDRALQRAHPPGLRLYPSFPGVPAAQSPGARSSPRCGCGAACRGDGLRGRQPQPRPRQLVGPRCRTARGTAVRGAVRAGRAGHGPRQRRLQPQPPHHRVALPQRRHHRVHAAADVGRVERPADLRLVILHGGAGALPLGRFRGSPRTWASPARRADGRQRVVRHLRVPPGRHRLPAGGRAARQHPVRVEMVGAVQGIDPETGHHYDDTRRYLEAAGLDDDASTKIYEANARRAPRLAVPGPARATR